jgi:hydrogenase maturation protease
MQTTNTESNKTLVVGIGNPSRSDDAVGLYIINAINRRLGRRLIGEEVAFRGGEVSTDGRVGTIFVQQLGPEIADVVKDYDLAIFVDAHTGAYAEEIMEQEVSPAYGVSAFSHHLEPGAVLALVQMLYGRTPHALAVSVRGYDFEFSSELSEATRSLAEQVIDKIMGIISTLGRTSSHLSSC